MAIIPQLTFFKWEEIEELGDLDRLKLVIDTLPDKELMECLERVRGHGRDDYPIRAVWNSIMAGIVFGHESIESLRREMSRNAALLKLCGFDPFLGFKAVPPAHAYSRFLKLLIGKKDLLDKLFRSLVEAIAAELPDFGTHLAIDGKHVESFGKPVKDEEKKADEDGRRDTDADWGRKEYRGTDSGGRAWEKIVSWFGYKIHLLVDATYELPVDFRLAKASAAEQPMAVEIITELKDRLPSVAQNTQFLMGDKGYDGSKVIEASIEGLGAKPVIDIRNMWKDGETTKVVPGQENVIYDVRGQVFCVCPQSGAQHLMVNGGFEADRNCHSFLCPAKAKGISCRSLGVCPVRHKIRIPLETDRRVFTPVARSTPQWDRLYAMRTAVERVNARIDRSFMFEHHFIRGQKKMEARVYLAFFVMLAMALGRARQNREDLMRSLVKHPA